MDKNFKNLIDTTCKNSIVIHGIYKMESTFRPTWFRILEYMYLSFSILLNLLFKKRVKNITISIFQVGLLTILRYYNNALEDTHNRYIDKLSSREIILIYRSLSKVELVKIVDWYIEEMLSTKEFCDRNSKYRYIGLRYNGSYCYAIALEKEINKLVNI